MDRRHFITVGGAATIGAGIGWVIPPLIHTRDRVFREVLADDSLRLSPGYCDESMIATYGKSLGELTRGEALFYGAEGQALERVKLPIGWDTLTEAHKQDWRDAQRRHIGLKHDIADPDEWSIPVTSPHKVLVAAPERATIKSLTEENTQKITLKDSANRTRQAYVEAIFGERFYPNTRIGELVEGSIAGLAGGESRFDSSLVSSAGAVGIFQLMPSIIANRTINPGAHSPGSVALSLVQQTELAVNLFKDNWRVLGSFIPRVAEQYFDGDEKAAIEYFMFPLLINVYNTGTTIGVGVLRKFMTAYPTVEAIEDDWEVQYPDGIGRDVFWYYTQYGRHNPEAKNYGPESAAYFYKTMAMSGLLNPARATIKPQRAQKNAIVVGAVVGAVAGAVAATMASKRGQETPLVDPSNALSSPMRRRITTAIAGLAATALLTSSTGGDIEPVDGAEDDGAATAPSPVAVTKKAFAPQNKAPGNILKGIFLKRAQAPRAPISKKHHPITITPWLDKFARGFNLSPRAIRSELSTLSGRLDPSWTNLDYRLSGLGESALKEPSQPPAIGTNNHPAYLTIHEPTERVIRKISRDLNRTLLRSQGLDPAKYRVRLIISSAARDQAYAKRYLKNSSPFSSHPYGIAFDIAHRFDILDLTTQQSYHLTQQDPSGTYKIIKNTLDALLNQMQHRDGRFKGSIFAIQEGGESPHIHVTNRCGEETWQPGG